MVNLESDSYKDKTKAEKQAYMDKKIAQAEDKLDTINKRIEIINDYKANLLDKKPKN